MTHPHNESRTAHPQAAHHHHAGMPAAGDVNSLGNQLRTRTLEQHQAAEHHAFHSVLFGAQGVARAREAYARNLGQHLTIQEAFEPLLKSAAHGGQGYGTMVRPYHYHLTSLREDISAIGVDAEYLKPLQATQNFAAMIRECAARDGFSLLGVWYVFEGSTNGGTIIAKRVRELLQLEGDAGTKFINPHGQLVRPRWGEWKQSLDSLTFDQAQQDAIIQAAQETFTHTGYMMGEVFDRMNQGAVTVTHTAHTGAKAAN